MHTMLESALSATTMPTSTTTTAITVKGRRDLLQAQVHWPNGPKPMSEQPFKVAFQNIYRGITNANVILEEGVKRDWDIIFLAEPWVEEKAGGWATMV